MATEIDMDLLYCTCCSGIRGGGGETRRTRLGELGALQQHRVDGGVGAPETDAGRVGPVLAAGGSHGGGVVAVFAGTVNGTASVWVIRGGSGG